VGGSLWWVCNEEKRRVDEAGRHTDRRRFIRAFGNRRKCEMVVDSLIFEVGVLTEEISPNLHHISGSSGEQISTNYITGLICSCNSISCHATSMASSFTWVSRIVLPIRSTLKTIWKDSEPAVEPS